MPPIPGRIFPIDPSLGPSDPNYRYSVVVEVTCGGTTNDARIEVLSDTILDGSAAIEQAIQDWQQGNNQGPYSPPPHFGDVGRCTYRGRIVSIGRNGNTTTMFPGR